VCSVAGSHRLTSCPVALTLLHLRRVSGRMVSLFDSLSDCIGSTSITMCATTTHLLAASALLRPCHVFGRRSRHSTCCLVALALLLLRRASGRIDSPLNLLSCPTSSTLPTPCIRSDGLAIRLVVRPYRLYFNYAVPATTHLIAAPALRR
jgi:hypothetical protein